MIRAEGARQYCSNRVFEWTMAIALTAIGLHLWFAPESGSISSFRGAIEGLGPYTVAAIYSVVGTIRVLALSRNGKWPVYGPWLRAAGSACAACVWAEMAFVLYYVPEVGAPSPYIWVYIVLTGSESYSTFRAIRDGIR